MIVSAKIKQWRGKEVTCSNRNGEFSNSRSHYAWPILRGLKFPVREKGYHRSAQNQTVPTTLGIPPALKGRMEEGSFWKWFSFLNLRSACPMQRLLWFFVRIPVLSDPQHLLNKNLQLLLPHFRDIILHFPK